jgi:hypothetical protein
MSLLINDSGPQTADRRSAEVGQWLSEIPHLEGHEAGKFAIRHANSAILLCFRGLRKFFTLT